MFQKVYLRRSYGSLHACNPSKIFLQTLDELSEKTVNIFLLQGKCGQNADTEHKTKIPNSYELAIWEFLMVPGAAFEYSKSH